MHTLKNSNRDYLAQEFFTLEHHKIDKLIAGFLHLGKLLRLAVMKDSNATSVVYHKGLT